MDISQEQLKELISFTHAIKLLYVEDNLLARKNTLEVFEDFFNDITIAKNGVEGFETFKASNFDLIITDINMPKMNGIEMTSAIREINIDIPILILSAYSESNYFMETIKLGVEGYLLKPIDIEQFIDVLLRVSKHITHQKENIEYKHTLEEKVLKKTQELYHAYLHDSLTGLENTYMLNKYIENPKYTYILLLDVSNFSVVNKEYGRDFSTEALKQIAKELTHNINEQHLLLKAESDRFIILSKLKTKDEIEEFTWQLQSYFDQKNIYVDTNEININFSIGIASLDDPSNALVNVEYALEATKSIGHRFHAFYQENQDYLAGKKETIKWLRITKEMILNDAIFPYFQPMQDIKTGKIVKYEALARGLYEGKIIEPFKFLDAAEMLGLITSVTKMMINKTFIYFENKETNFSLNITERDLLEGYLIDFLADKASKYKIKPQQVTLEILENITTKVNTDTIIDCLNTLQKIGYKIAVDDFGVENSNFSRLLDISIDIIKIDGIFIKNILKNDKDYKIVRGIVSMAKSLDIDVVAEYVASQEIYEIVKECGVDVAQGYFIGKPEKELLQGD